MIICVNSKNMKEATMLIERCQKKLAHTGLEIDEALKRLETMSKPEHSGV